MGNAEYMGTHPIFESDFDCLTGSRYRHRDMGKEKIHVNIVVIGHVDSGKSTTTGHLIYNAVASTSERLKSSKRKPKKWAKAHSSTRGFWTSSRPNANVASPSTLRSGSSRRRSFTSPSSTRPAIAISSRT